MSCSDPSRDKLFLDTYVVTLGVLHHRFVKEKGASESSKISCARGAANIGPGGRLVRTSDFGRWGRGIQPGVEAPRASRTLPPASKDWGEREDQRGGGTPGLAQPLALAEPQNWAGGEEVEGILDHLVQPSAQCRNPLRQRQHQHP